MRVSQLKLIMEGNISKAKSLGGIQLDAPLDSGDFDIDDKDQCSRPEQPVENWTSIQFSEAMSVLRTFLHKDYMKCQNCGKKSPKITKPFFGWFHVVTYLFLSLLDSIFKNYNLLTNLSVSLSINLYDIDYDRCLQLYQICIVDAVSFLFFYLFWIVPIFKCKKKKLFKLVKLVYVEKSWVLTIRSLKFK